MGDAVAGDIGPEQIQEMFESIVFQVQDSGSVIHPIEAQVVPTDSPRSGCWQTGLPNLGNTCYLCASLQMLLHLPWRKPVKSICTRCSDANITL